MRNFFMAALALLAVVGPARAEPSVEQAVLIKQFLICDGVLASGCEAFTRGAFSQAYIVFTAAAANGEVAAQNNLGMLYESGAGTPRDDNEAARLYLEAAEAGLPVAQYNFAMLTAAKHVTGITASQPERDTDLATAYMWLTFASEQGLALATESRQELTGFMSESAIATANRRIRARQRK